MLGKIVVHAADREAARRVLVAALDETAILGLTTNAGFLRALAAGDAFRDATIDTAWLDRHDVPAPDDELPRLLVAWAAAGRAAADTAPGLAHPFQSDGFRVAGPRAPIRVELDRDVFVDRAPDGRGGTVDGVPVRQLAADRNHLEVVVDGREVHAVVDVDKASLEVALRGQRHAFTPPDRLAGAVAVSDGTVEAPMPGTVLDVRVAAGDAVEEGQTLGTLEAMKMELALTAPFAGTVAEVAVAAGDQVALGARLLVVTAADADDVADGAGDASGG